MRTSDEIDRIADAIEAVLADHDLAIPNPWAVIALEQLAIRMTAIDHYAARKARDIASKAGVFYSERKHRTYPGGADALYHKMRYALLGTIRSQAGVYRDRGT